MTTSLPTQVDVSLVIPVRDRCGLLVECLRSIREPEGLSWEAIVIDDGSDEPIERAISKLGLEKHLTYIRQEPAGASAARNKGLSAARGRFIKFLDSDDELEPGILARQAAAIDRHGCDVVFSDWKFIGDLRDPRVGDGPLRIAIPKGPVLISLLDGWWCANFSYLYRTEIARRTGWDERLRNWQDFDYVVRIAMTGARFERVPGVAGGYRLHGQAQITGGDRSSFIDSRQLVLDKLVTWVERLPHDAAELSAARRAIAQLHWDAAHALYSLGQPEPGEALLRRADLLCPGYVPRAHPAIVALVRGVGAVHAQRLLALRRRASAWLRQRRARRAHG